MSRARVVDNPEPGFFRLQLVRKGPYVPALIFLPCPLDPDFGFPLDRSRRLQGLIDGKPVSGFDICRIWNFGAEITFAEYEYLMATTSWARAYAPNDPAANPMRPIDLHLMQSIF